MINVLIGVAVVALLLARQLRPRLARETSAARFVLILGVIGVVETVNAAKGHSVSTGTIALLVVGLLIGAAFGAIRGLTVRVWRAADGAAWQQGSLLTAALWIVSLAAHLGIDVLVSHSTDIKGLDTATILLYLAITLGVQRELVRVRVSRIDSATPRRAVA